MLLGELFVTEAPGVEIEDGMAHIEIVSGDQRVRLCMSPRQFRTTIEASFAVLANYDRRSAEVVPLRPKRR